jgi:hypothetical protein
MASAGKQAAPMDALFIQTGSAFSAKDGEITLHGIADATVYFTDRPRREAGHMASEPFLELWSGPSATFVVEPPHAVLSFLEEPAEALTDVVVVLHQPRRSGRDLTYKVDVLNGTLPATGGACSLFIDAFGRSLAPVSVRGLRRPRRTSASQATA